MDHLHFIPSGTDNRAFSSLTGVLFLLSLAFLLFRCENQRETSDAFGHFEAEEVLVSAEAQGRLLSLDLREGQTLEQGVQVGLVDTVGLFLQKRQLLAQLQSLEERLQDARPDILVLERQLANLRREQRRMENLVARSAATVQQLDDLNGQVEVVEQQIESAREKESLANRAILSEADPIRARIAIVEEQLERCRIHNPVNGTVLLQLARAGEVVATGKPLYKVAPLDPLILRAYISGRQLPRVRLGDPVEVLVDGESGGLQRFSGTVSWISDQAEFTPKTIQTREERVNLVYAMKISVPNDGSLKIGMPGEVRFTSGSAANSPQD